MSHRWSRWGHHNASSIAYVRRWSLDGAAVGVGVVVVTISLLVAQQGVSPLEEWVFRLFNDLPDAFFRPMWAAQFLGLLLLPVGFAIMAFGIGWLIAAVST